MLDAHSGRTASSMPQFQTLPARVGRRTVARPPGWPNVIVDESNLPMTEPAHMPLTGGLGSGGSGDPYATFIGAALAPMAGGPVPRDIPDRNSTGTASQKLRTRSTLSAPDGSKGGTWDLNVITSPMPNFSFLYAKRPSGGKWEPYTAVPRSTYAPQRYEDSFATDVLSNNVARYRAAGQGYQLSYTGPTLADQGRVVAAQLPTHFGKLNTRPFGNLGVGYTVGASIPIKAHQIVDGGQFLQNDIFPDVGGDGVTSANYMEQGWSGIVGRWFDLPPGTEEGILQSTPTALQAKAKGTLLVRSDFDTGRNDWNLATERLQVGLSRNNPEDKEITEANQVRWAPLGLREPLAPLAERTWGCVEEPGFSVLPVDRYAGAAPFDLKTSTILYSGMSAEASITIEETLYLIVDPQAQGALAPNRSLPIPCSTAVLDYVSSQQQTSASIRHFDGDIGSQKGLIGDMLGTAGGILATILPGPWGALAGTAGALAQGIGNQLNLVPSRGRRY